jgi:hypothetical protein
MKLFESNYGCILRETCMQKLGGTQSEQLVDSYCALLLNSVLYTNIYQHKIVPSSISVSCRVLEETFGRAVFNEINEKVGWLESIPISEGVYYSHDSTNTAYTKAYQPTEIGLSDIAQCLPQLERVQPALNIKKNPGKALLSKHKNGSRSYHRFLMPLGIKINIKALKALDSELSEKEFLKDELDNSVDFKEVFATPESCLRLSRMKLIRLRLYLNALIVTGRKPIYHQYCQSPAGRWYSIGPTINLQAAPRQIRNAAFTGNQLIDIDSCHFTLLSQMASELNSECPAIKNLIENKIKFRKDLANRVDSSSENIKKALIALIYGARLSPSNRGALSRIFQPRQLASFLEDLEVREIYEEIRKASKVVIEHAIKVTKKKGVLVNAMGKQKRVSNSTREEQLAHLLQGAEALILSKIGATYGKKMRLLLHDGFICTKSVNPVEVVALVKRETGWEINLSSTIF